MARTRILVVDDEEEICSITKAFLEKKDYDVQSAYTSEGALGLIHQERPQIVLLDIRLGEESGLELLRKIKEFDKNIKVIMVTALDDQETIRQARALGADDYATKPFTANYLHEIILQKISLLSAKQESKQ